MRKPSKLIGVILSLICSMGLFHQVEVVSTGSRTLVVGDGQRYKTIQSAMDAAKEYDVVFVKNGTYKESITISKNNITLKGESFENTLLEQETPMVPNIVIHGALNTKVLDMSIKCVSYGIKMEKAIGSSISRCKIDGNGGNTGIYLDQDCEQTSFMDCEILNNQFGIICYQSLTYNISNCFIYQNAYGITTYISTTDYIKPHQIVIQGNKIYKNDLGCQISELYCRFEKNDLIQNKTGMWIRGSKSDIDEPDKTKIIGNRIFDNQDGGIELNNCHSVTVEDNYIDIDPEDPKKTSVGIVVRNGASNNRITRNTIDHYKLGLLLESPNTKNWVYQNDFLENKVQAKDFGTQNQWSFQSLGNYWSDYQGNSTHDESVGDVPYTLHVMDPFPMTKRNTEDVEVPTLPTSLPKTEKEPNEIVPGGNPTYGFLDLQNHWGKEAILYVSGLSILQGKNGQQFCPDDNITRGELAKALIRLLDRFNETARTSMFSDLVATNEDYYYILSAYEEGIIRGYTDGTFHPDESIKRQDLCVMLSKVLTDSYQFSPIKAVDSATTDFESGTLTLIFKDTDHISNYAKDGVATTVNYGLVKGKPDNVFDPKGQTTRAELAAILYKLIKNYDFPK
jgi:nitrous oxidase accessory protein NosD